MGNTEGQQLKRTICLGEEAISKLKDFVTDLDSDDDGNYDRELHFVVLEGDCVLVRIYRFNLWTWEAFESGFWDNLKFAIQWYHMYENGEFDSFSSEAMNMEDTLRWIQKHVSPEGDTAIEDCDQKALDVFVGVEKSFQLPSKSKKRIISVEKLRSAMMRHMSSSFSSE